MKDTEILNLLDDGEELKRQLAIVNERCAVASRHQSPTETYWRIEEARFWKKVAEKLAIERKFTPEEIPIDYGEGSSREGFVTLYRCNNCKELVGKVHRRVHICNEGGV